MMYDGAFCVNGIVVARVGDGMQFHTPHFCGVK